MKSKKITHPLFSKMKLWIFCEFFTNFANSILAGGLKKKSEGGLKKWGESRNERFGGRRGSREGQERVDNFLL